MRPFFVSFLLKMGLAKGLFEKKIVTILCEKIYFAIIIKKKTAKIS